MLVTSRAAIRMKSHAVTVASCCSLAFTHIPHVVSMRPDDQMINPDTGRVIACVSNMHTCWNRTVCQFEGIAMGQMSTRSVRMEHSIPGGGSSCGPYPAFATLIDLRPKSDVDVHRCPASTLPATETASIAASFTRVPNEAGSACFADAVHEESPFADVYHDRCIVPQSVVPA